MTADDDQPLVENSPKSPLVLADLDAWREWLIANEHTSKSVWVLIAKKNVTSPTSLSYQGALEEALCGGWIDGQRRTFDATTFVQRFTPRRSRSNWSKRNVEIIGSLEIDGRLRDRGRAEVRLAQHDGRWENAYPRQSEATVPDDLRDALAEAPAAQSAFDALNRAEQFTAMLPILTSRTETTRARIIARLVDRLGEGNRD